MNLDAVVDKCKVYVLADMESSEDKGEAQLD